MLIVHGGSCPQGVSVIGGKLSPRGSCPRGVIVLGGNCHRGGGGVDVIGGNCPRG